MQLDRNFEKWHPRLNIVFSWNTVVYVFGWCVITEAINVSESVVLSAALWGKINWKKALCAIKVYIQKWKVLQTLRCKRMMFFHQINGILFIFLMPGGVLSKENRNTLVSELLQGCLSPLRFARMCCWRSSHLVLSRMIHTQTVCVKPLITKVQHAWSWDWPPVGDMFFHYIWTRQRKSQKFALIPSKCLLKTLVAF